jgi:hypothetical protein
VAISLTPEQALLQAALLPPGSAAQRLPVAGEFRVDQLFIGSVPDPLTSLFQLASPTNSGKQPGQPRLETCTSWPSSTWFLRPWSARRFPPWS